LHDARQGITVRSTQRKETMGAWGLGSFDNDDAADFLAEVTDGSGLASIRAIFSTVLGADYVEAPDASQAIAAVEIVAAALGRPTPAAQNEHALVDWLARTRPTVDTGLTKQAAQALDRILAADSELRELWEEEDEASDWQAAVEDLRSRLPL
jgi:hypothetical protein